MRGPLSFLVALAALGGAVVTPSAESSVHVSPTTIAIAPGETSGSFTLRNSSTLPLSFDLQAFAWANTPAAGIDLTPTDDLIVFPLRVLLAPGETRRVRVGTRLPTGPRERSYRVIVRQTPMHTATGGVTMLIKLSLPVFVLPKSRTVTATLTPPQLVAGMLSVRLLNEGPRHVTPQRIEAVGYGASGERVWGHDFTAWYLLAGEARDYTTRLPASDCRRVASIHVTATFAEGRDLTLRERRGVPAGACRTP